MAGASMAEPLDKIGPSIPYLRFRRIGFKYVSLMEKRVPPRQQRTPIKWKGERGGAVLGADRLLRHQVGIERLHVGLGRPGEMRIRKRWIEMSAVAVDALAHGALERRIEPSADARLRMRGDVGAVHYSERRLDRAARGFARAVRIGMAYDAIAEPGLVADTGDGGGCIEGGSGVWTRRVGAPRQSGPPV